MPRRWGLNTRVWAYRYLCLRDGEHCTRCSTIPTAQNTLDIDHIDGDSWNSDPENLRLLCRGCNVALANIARKDQVELVRFSSARKERERGKPSTKLVREVVDYKRGSSEMQANLLFELQFRRWALERVKDQGGLLKKEAINAGAEIVGCSPTTTAKYLDKLTSAAGPLQEGRDLLGDTILVFKPIDGEEVITLG